MRDVFSAFGWPIRAPVIGRAAQMLFDRALSAKVRLKAGVDPCKSRFCQKNWKQEARISRFVLMSSLNDYYRKRTQAHALQVIRLFSGRVDHPAYEIIAKQAIRSASSTAANYRAMCLGRSPAERFSKLCIVVEEADETAFWLELLESTGMISPIRLNPVVNESQELAKILIAYRASIKKNNVQSS